MTNHLHNPQDMLQYCAVQQDVNQDLRPLFEYETAQLLSKVCHTSSGSDGLLLAFPEMFLWVSWYGHQYC